MNKTVLAIICCLVSYVCQAGVIRGRITNDHHEPLPFATIFIKGTTAGTTSNAQGQYHLELPEGSYTIVCQYMGYNKTEKQVTVTAADQEINITLAPQSLQIKEIVIKSGGEDPAYAIIRQAIKKRSYYRHHVQEYTCNDYIKGVFKLRNVPTSFFGKKVDKDDLGVDSTGQGVVFLSESLTKVAFREPDEVKVEVLSARQSGGGLGFSFPAFIELYDNNVTAVLTQISKRGYISPIAENALSFYKYRLEGTFLDDGKTVNKIAVIPKRKYEPLFSGYIFITDDDWRIHSADLLITKEYQLELMDTLRIRQIHVPVNKDVWRTKDQVLYITAKQFGFDMAGTSVNVYSNYNLHPELPKKYFDKTILKYDTAFDKKILAYWDSIRPVPLEADELKDFHVKDSIAVANRDSLKSSRQLDTLRKKQKPVKVTDFLWSGVTHNYYFKRDTGIYSHRLEIAGLLKEVEYNTVEGLVLSVEPSMNFSMRKDQSLTIAPNIRYGFSNSHLNAYADIIWRGDAKLAGRHGINTWTASGGKRVSQFNHDNPISPLANEVYTLLLKENYIKLYENKFAQLSFKRRFQTNTVFSVGVTYEDRTPLENTTDFVIFKDAHKQFSPNHPYELADIPFEKHQALVLDLNFSFQPGQHYIELPDRKIAIGSKYPTFSMGYSKGIPDIAGSDANFDKWKFHINDQMNLKLFGEFFYNLGIGGFINSKQVDIPDYQHFNGNQTFYNMKYLNSFQLAPYYKYSTVAPFYATANVEHHFNGLLTNKVPLLKQLKWNLVAGSNAFYVNKDNNYVEVFAGLENIFKLIRVDVIAGYQSKDNTRIGVRVGLGGVLGGMMRARPPR
jgi:hypothetical protein